MVIRHVLVMLGPSARVPMAISAAVVASWWESGKWWQNRYLVKSIEGSTVAMLIYFLINVLVNIQRNVFVSELYFKL